MPDWSYRTVLQPLLFALPPAAARDLALGAIGALGANAVGRALIDLLGHMRAPDGVRVTVAGIDFPSPAGIGCALDPAARATSGLARFGAGFVEVGPIAVAGRRGPVGRDVAAAAMRLADPLDALDLETAARRLAACRSRGAVRLLARLDGAGSATEVDAPLVARLAPLVDGFTIAASRGPWTAAGWQRLAAAVAAAAGESPRPLVLAVDGSVATGPGRQALGRAGGEAARERLRALRASLGASVPLLASGGVHEPQDAIALRDAGADLVAVDSGLVFGGPGLPKRINEALAAGLPDAPVSRERAADMSWLWTLLLGAGMFVGSVLALGIAATRVVLPYDEHFAGLTRAALHAANPRLLPFLTHDRVTLAGAMLAIAVLYVGLSWFGTRRGRHWAYVAILASSAVGTASFFLFLGFGYFDPFHAFVTAVLLQLALLGAHGRVGPPRRLPPPMRREDRAWRLGLWGQLALVVQSVGFIGAGLVIAGIGATHVFVQEDLEFLQTTAAGLQAAGPNLVPLVAHDRATLGGMLLAAGVTILLATLWGFRPGERWLWWTLLLAGLPGYAAAIGVHYVVGYESAFHLAPAFAGLALFAAALAAAYPSLCRR